MWGCDRTRRCKLDFTYYCKANHLKFQILFWRKILQDTALKDTGLSRVAVVEVLLDAIADRVFGSCALELDAMLGQMADTIFKTL